MDLNLINKYVQMIQVEDRMWMSSNLNIHSFRNGDPIIEITSKDDWALACKNKQPAFCYNDFDKNKFKQYGCKYNYFALIDPRGFAPEGWRIPEKYEWAELVDFFGGRYECAMKLKSTYGWANNENGTNSSKLSILPGNDIGLKSESVTYWTITIASRMNWLFNISKRNSVYFSCGSASSACYVRCIKELVRIEV